MRLVPTEASSLASRSASENKSSRAWHEPGVWLRELACERDALILSSSLTESIREQVERCPALRIYDTALSKRLPHR